MNRRKLTIRKDDKGWFIKTDGRKYRPDYEYQANTTLNKIVLRDRKNWGLTNPKSRIPTYKLGDKVSCEDSRSRGAVFGENLSVEDVYIGDDNLEYLEFYNWVDESKFN